MSWPREHRLVDNDLNWDEFRRRVSAQVGMDLGMVTRPATADTPGIIRFERMGRPEDTEVEKVDVDPRIVVSTIDAMVAERNAARRRAVATHERSSVEQLAEPELARHAAEQLEAFDAATTDAQRWAAFRAVLEQAATAETTFNEAALTAWRDRVDHFRDCRTCNPTGVDPATGGP